MAKDQEVERIAKKLDKMVHKNNTDGAMDLLRELKNMKMSLETLQSTRIGMSVNAVRKHSSDEEVQTLAKSLIKAWKKLLDGSEGKTEEKKKVPPPLQSSSSKDRPGSSDFSKRPETPKTPTTSTTPTTPTTPKMTSFPPPPVTTDSVRNKCRELLVSALQTDDDYKTIGADCEALAAEIEDYILLFSQSYLGAFFKSTDMKYKSRLRSRISNLKDQKNPDLRRNVLCGNISSECIASMTAEEMASAELKEIRKALTKESIREHQLSKVGGTETDMFVCGKCKGKSCTYTQVQTRSADEPMTTFVMCNDCGNRWKVRATPDT
ncbi:transcription elongation factor A protein 2 isoform X1 [Tachysurus ichikawai]